MVKNLISVFLCTPAVAVTIYPRITYMDRGRDPHQPWLDHSAIVVVVGPTIEIFSLCSDSIHDPIHLLTWTIFRMYRERAGWLWGWWFIQRRVTLGWHRVVDSRAWQKNNDYGPAFNCTWHLLHWKGRGTYLTQGKIIIMKFIKFNFKYISRIGFLFTGI